MGRGGQKSQKRGDVLCERPLIKTTSVSWKKYIEENVQFSHFYLNTNNVFMQIATHYIP